jgi:hypothetical protein
MAVYAGAVANLPLRESVEACETLTDDADPEAGPASRTLQCCARPCTQAARSFTSAGEILSANAGMCPSSSAAMAPLG